MIGKIISHYRILEKLGEGGMGVVYKGEDTKLKRTVALKFLPPHISESGEEKERFIHEAQSASALNHPNVTTIYGIEESPEGLFIAMEYVEGKTLKQIIEKETLSIKKVLDIGIQVCEGLAMAHEKGIVHRDIKSDNIMLTPRGQVKIMDFGLAKLKGATKLTKTRSTLGTLAYMSPEQAQGEEVDSRSDIFSFGVVLYELLTGKLPFGGEHQAAIVYSIINEEPQPIARYNSKVTSELERIVSKALVKDKEDRYQHIDDLLTDLRRERKGLDYVKTGQIPKEVTIPKPKRRVLPIVIPASIVFILVLLFLILRPFKFEIGPEKKATAEENRLAIMYFENIADREDKERLGEIVTELLITNLSESQYINVVSSQRLYDILKLLGKEGAKIIDKSVASEVATRAGAKWMLIGKILKVEPRMVMTAQLVDVKSGEVKASQDITGEPKEDVFSLVDKLTAALKKDLSLPAQAAKEETPKVATVTTHSQEAYRYYLEGMDYCFKHYFREAEKSFKEALTFDSTFAMAYFWLAEASRNLTGPEYKALIAKAVKYSDKVSQKEKLYIQAWQAGAAENTAQYIKALQKIVERYPDEKLALLALGICYRELEKFHESIDYLSRAIAIDSLYKEAYNALAYVYNQVGDFEKSIWAINKYISLAPGEANPYNTRGNLYAYNGRLDQAIESYKKALEIKPDFYNSLIKLGDMYLFKRDYAKAESCYKELASSSDKNIRSGGRTRLAYIPLYQGKFEQTLEALDDGLTTDKMEQIKGEPSWKHYLKAMIYEEKKDLNLALNEIKKSMEISRKESPDNIFYWQDHYAYLLAENGEVTAGQEVANALKRDIEKKDPGTLPAYTDYWYMVGKIELARGNLETAITDFVQATKGTPRIDACFLLSGIYLKLGKLGAAVAELEKGLLRYDENRAQSIYGVKTYYLLGLAYEKSGWNDKAIQQYEEFLDIWKNADPGIPEVTDAKERLKRLKK